MSPGPLKGFVVRNTFIDFPGEMTPQDKGRLEQSCPASLPGLDGLEQSGGMGSLAEMARLFSENKVSRSMMEAQGHVSKRGEESGGLVGPVGEASCTTQLGAIGEASTTSMAETEYEWPDLRLEDAPKRHSESLMVSGAGRGPPDLTMPLPPDYTPITKHAAPPPDRALGGLTGGLPPPMDAVESAVAGAAMAAAPAAMLPQGASRHPMAVPPQPLAGPFPEMPLHSPAAVPFGLQPLPVLPPQAMSQMLASVPHSLVQPPLASPGGPKDGYRRWCTENTAAPVPSSASAPARVEPVAGRVLAPPYPVYRVRYRGTVHLCAAPAMDSGRSGHTLRFGEDFHATEEVHGLDRRVYLRLSDGRGWAFNDAALLPEDPTLELVWAPGTKSMSSSPEVTAITAAATAAKEAAARLDPSTQGAMPLDPTTQQPLDPATLTPRTRLRLEKRGVLPVPQRSRRGRRGGSTRGADEAGGAEGFAAAPAGVSPQADWVPSLPPPAAGLVVSGQVAEGAGNPRGRRRGRGRRAPRGAGADGDDVAED